MKPRRISMTSEESGHEAHDVGEPTGRRTVRSTSRRSLMKHPLAIVALAVVALYALAAVVLNVAVDTDRVRSWVEPTASTALARPVSTGGARVALLPRPAVHLSDVRVDNSDAFNGPALAFVERVRLDVRLLPLLIGRVNVHRVHLDAPRVYLGIDENGTSNFGDLIPSAASAAVASGGPIVLTVREVGVSDASLSYFNGPAARSFTVSGADARLALGPDGPAGWRADMEVESDSLLARMATVTEEIVHLEGPTATLTARSDGAGRAIEVTGGVLELAGEALSLSGRIAALESSRPSYDLQLTNDAMDAGVLAAILPASTRSTRMPVVDGRLGVTFQVTRARSTGQPPLVRGSLHLTDVAVVVSGQTVVDGVSGTIGVRPDTVLLDSLAGLFADGPFELSGTIARDTRAIALRTRALPDLDALDRLGLVPPGTTLSGDAGLDLSVAGRLDSLDAIEVTGVVTMEGLQAKHARVGVPLYVPVGALTLAGGRVGWEELPVLLGQDQVVTTGWVDGLFDGLLNSEDAEVPSVDVTVRGPRVDLGEALPAREGTPDVTYARLAFAHLGQRRIEGRPASTVSAERGFSRPRTLPFHGTVRLEVDTLDYRRYHLEAVAARIELSDSVLAVDVPSFTAWGGPASGGLRLGIGDAPAQPFALTLTSRAGSAEALLAALTPVSGAVSGTIALELEVTGQVDSGLLPLAEGLEGHASLLVEEGRLHDTGPNLVVADFLGSDDWADVPFSTWDAEIDIRGDRLEVRRSEQTGEGGRVAFSGMLHLDGSHDLSLGVSIPPDRLETVSLRRTGIGQSVLDHLSAAGSSLDLGLRMSGDLSAPQLEPDASNAVVLTR